uniref:AAA ATPase domain-containing protein n=1 Tax=Candidatus Kentrum sp. MB TaxID=2138164 RepID=A0A450XD97_9GAMM|nr:MAG: AAA ATPase domain-containing protein [Candidatus Kentron sp. MB]VFK31091.1 MAG: AAA ATPase domain-containing protein [Candidatus Kentron sp. MB]VFK75515.1 MAG: AAA ATPase domain-containing protein [Candidatus Kentron sp. MB]
MHQIESISISGFKSIRELKGLPLSTLNVLIGANGAGKSNFLSFLRLMDNLVERRLQLFVRQQGGPDAQLHFGRKNTKRLHGAFGFGWGSYEFDLIPTTDWFSNRRSTRSMKARALPRSIVEPCR